MDRDLHIFDLHCDTLDRLVVDKIKNWPEKEPLAYVDRSQMRRNKCNISLERTSAHTWVQCFAVFIPENYFKQDASDFFSMVSDFFNKQMIINSDIALPIKDARDISAALGAGKTASLLTVEGGTILPGRLHVVHGLKEAGVKMLTLTWNGPNAIGSGHDTISGLTTYGREAIHTLEEEKIVIDVSHLNDTGFLDFSDIYNRPFAASHSNLRSVCSHARNLTDYQFQTIVDASGVVGVNFTSDFIYEEAEKHRYDPTFEDIAKHIDKMLELGGENTICLGSDYDGTVTPKWLEGCENMATLHDYAEHRYGKGLTEKFFFTNALNFFIANETIQ